MSAFQEQRPLLPASCPRPRLCIKPTGTHFSSLEGHGWWPRGRLQTAGDGQQGGRESHSPPPPSVQRPSRGRGNRGEPSARKGAGGRGAKSPSCLTWGVSKEDTRVALMGESHMPPRRGPRRGGDPGDQMSPGGPAPAVLIISILRSAGATLLCRAAQARTRQARAPSQAAAACDPPADRPRTRVTPRPSPAELLGA